jgi:hypothetical protein
LTLREHCAPDAPQAGTLEAKAGEPIAWTDAKTIVTRPFEVRSRDAVSLTIAPVTRDLKATDASIDLAVPAGRTVGVLKDAGEGSCYVVIESMVGLTDCPTPERFEAEGWDGTRRSGEYRWCVQPDGADGWLLVDDQLDVSAD